MIGVSMSCILLADRHHRLAEGIRGMLETSFEALFIVADETSLVEGAARLQPTVVIIDLSMAPGRLPQVLQRLRTSSPRTKMLLLSVHDQASIARYGLAAQADGVVLKRAIATDLLPAIDAVLADRTFLSPGIIRWPRGDHSGSDDDNP
jgi:two-component system secretion response regulator SsrB